MNMSQQEDRKTVKEFIIKMMGSQCVRCNWSEHIAGLTFHHVNSSKKDFELNGGNLLKKWSGIEREVQKCILLCCNCHAIVHVIQDKQFLSEENIPQYVLPSINPEHYGLAKCNRCDSIHIYGNKCISYRVNWPTIEELVRSINAIGYEAVAHQLGTFDNTVRNYIKRSGLDPSSIGKRRGFNYSITSAG